MRGRGYCQVPLNSKSMFLAFSFFCIDIPHSNLPLGGAQSFDILVLFKCQCVETLFIHIDSGTRTL